MRVTDFGLARAGASDAAAARTNSYIGTVEYMAPEVGGVGHSFFLSFLLSLLCFFLLYYVSFFLPLPRAAPAGRCGDGARQGGRLVVRRRPRARDALRGAALPGQGARGGVWGFRMEAFGVEFWWFRMNEGFGKNNADSRSPLRSRPPTTHQPPTHHPKPDRAAPRCRRRSAARSSSSPPTSPPRRPPC